MADLNAVRQRTGLGPYTGSTAKAELERAIAVGRMTELVFENYRLYYLQAIQKTSPRVIAARAPSRGSRPGPLPRVEFELNSKL